MKMTIGEVYEDMTDIQKTTVQYMVGRTVVDSYDEFKNKVSDAMDDLTRVRLIKIGNEYFISKNSLLDILDEIVQEVNSKCP